MPSTAIRHAPSEMMPDVITGVYSLKTKLVFSPLEYFSLVAMYADLITLIYPQSVILSQCILSVSSVSVFSKAWHRANRILRVSRASSEATVLTILPAAGGCCWPAHKGSGWAGLRLQVGTGSPCRHLLRIGINSCSPYLGVHPIKMNETYC